MDFYVCSLIKYDGDNYVVSKSTDDKLPEGKILQKKGIYHETFDKYESFLINDIQKFEESQPFKHYYKSGISVPIDGFGVFQAVSDKKDFFNPEDLELTELFISHVDNALKRIRSEKEIREKESFYRAIFENTGTAMVIVDKDGTISLANSKMNRLVGYFDNDVSGKDWRDFVSDEDVKRMEKYHKLRRDDYELVPNEYDFQLLTKEGEKKHVFLTINMIPGTSKSVASLLDVTKRKEVMKEKDRYERLIKKDLDNKLDMIDTYIDILKDSELTDKQKEHLDSIKNKVDKSFELIEEVKKD